VAELQLAGRRVVVTRPESQARLLAEALERLGASVSIVPLVRIEPPVDPAALEAVLAEPGFDWVVFTSANAVLAVGERLAGALDGVRVAAVGPATAEAARRAGLEPSFVPGVFAGEEIVAGLEPLRGTRILLPQADIAEPGLAEELRRRGASVAAVAVYRTSALEPPPAVLAELRAADAVVLASGSAARSLAAQGGAGSAVVACIGPRTAAVARENGIEVGIVAREATTEGIIEALVSHFQET
jgi:uroporphyrinogen III methyltransferase / synthase